MNKACPVGTKIERLTNRAERLARIVRKQGLALHEQDMEIRYLRQQLAARRGQKVPND